MRRALVLVDLQAHFLASPGLEPAAGEVVGRAAALLAGFRAMDLPVIHVRTTVRRSDDRRLPHWRARGLWACEEGTPGHAAPAALASLPGEAIVEKAGYDPFDGPEGGLARALEGAGAREVVLAGLHLHACVRATALEASARGFAVVIAEDACASDDPVHAAATRRWLGSRLARFQSVEAVLRAGDEAEPLSGSARAESKEAAPPPPDTRARLDLAAHAQLYWQEQDAESRAAPLLRLATLLERDAEALARAISLEVGKPLRFARGEVARAALIVRAGADMAATLDESAPCGDRVRERRRPHGLVGLITPWNNPLAIPLGKLAPALALGNAAAWKPHPLALGVAKALFALCEAAGLPAGLVALLPGGADAGRALLDDERVRALSVTGGLALGRAAQEAAARRHVPLQAELGGNNAAIVWGDADPAEAAQKIAQGAFALAGQRCTANRRVIVERGFLPTFLPRLEAAARALRNGDPLDPATEVGPLVGAAAVGRVRALLERTRAAGLPVRALGEAPSGDRFLPPTLVLAEEAGAEVVQEESFGPVLVLQPAGDFDEALQLQRSVRQGLAAALFSPDPARRARFLARAEAGILKLDQATADAAPGAPFLGWKASGSGPAEHGRGAVEFFTRAQAVYRQ